MPDSQGVVLTNRANKVEGKHLHNYSTFDETLSYRLYNTLRFGEYTPSFVMEGVEKDNISVNSLDRIDSLSLNAPFKGSIRKIKESFMVPLMSILPMNWDRIYVQPSNGDDVPADANCVLSTFPQYFSEFWLDLYSKVISNMPQNVESEGDDAHTVTSWELSQWFTAFMRVLVLGEYVYSHGSLLNVCGYKASSQFAFVYPDCPHGSYDEFFDLVVSKLFYGIRSFVITWYEGRTSHSKKFEGLSSEHMSDRRWYGSFRSFLEFMREHPTCHFDVDIFYASDYWDTGEVGYLGEGAKLYADYLYDEFVGDNSDKIFSVTPFFYLPSHDDLSDDLVDMNPSNLNLSRLLAYQIVCAHFYTNSSIDFIYSAELYRQYVHDLGFYSNPNSQNTNFVWNGVNCPYDYLSGFQLAHQLYLDPLDAIINIPYARLCGTFKSWDSNNNTYIARFASFAAIFGFRKSLRYGDYFVGSRPRPLAPINTDVSVNSGAVSVIDITKSIQAQRFANAVMRSRQKIEEYVKSLFGNAPAPDYHNPFFLSRETEVIFGDEVQNTADTQMEHPNSRTANLASNSGRFTFTFHNDDNHPCIYLQLISFDIKRAYTRSIERQFFIRDRYDMFNPDFQYIGDQPIYGMELGYPVGVTIPDVFGYQTRDEEYKQRYDQASGGFVENLPGWILSDIDQSIQSVGHLDPDFIRSYNTELDQFFLSLTGFSLGSYFHFICITDNNVNAKRAMAVDPQILA